MRPAELTRFVVRPFLPELDVLGRLRRAEAFTHPLLQLALGFVNERYLSRHRLTPLRTRSARHGDLGHEREQRVLDLTGRQVLSAPAR